MITEPSIFDIKVYNIKSVNFEKAFKITPQQDGNKMFHPCC